MQERESLFEDKLQSDTPLSEDGKKKLRNAKIALFVVGGLTCVVSIIFMSISPEDYSWLPFYLRYLDIFVGIVFIGLGFLVNKSPYNAILSGLILYCLSILVTALDDPTNVARGIIFKILIIATLVKGLREAKDVQKEITNRDDLLDQGLNDL